MTLGDTIVWTFTFVIRLQECKESTLSKLTSEVIVDFQFIISASISIISIGVGIWVAFRRPIQIPISYEAITVKPIEGSEDERKAILEEMKVPLSDGAIQGSCLVTFKIWNSGRESITLLSDEAKPLTIAFEEGTRILACQKLQTVPSHLEVTIKSDAEKVLLVLPLLDPKESITLRVLVTEYVDYFPEIYVRVPGRKRIVRANNTRSATELKIAALAYFCAAIVLAYMFFFGPLFYGPPPLTSVIYFSTLVALFFLVGIVFFLWSWIQRRMHPYPALLPSTLLLIFFKLFLRGLPVLAIIGVVAIILYAVFGKWGLGVLFFIILAFYIPFGLWVFFFDISIKWLRKRNKAYNARLVGIISAIPSVAFLAMWTYMFLEVLLHR